MVDFYLSFFSIYLSLIKKLKKHEIISNHKPQINFLIISRQLDTMQKVL